MKNLCPAVSPFGELTSTTSVSLGMKTTGGPVIGWVTDGVYAACGFSGHGFMQAPAVGKAVAEELLDGESTFDLTPYRLERFSGDEIFPETLVL